MLFEHLLLVLLIISKLCISDVPKPVKQMNEARVEKEKQKDELEVV